jgi:hypothetical protein
MNRKELKKPIATAATGTEERHDSAYWLLIFYLFLIFFRPFDLVPSLKVLHSPMITGGLCVVVYVMTRYFRGKTIFPFSPITKVLAALSVWIMITIPFAFWIKGSLTTFYNDWSKLIILFLLLANVLQSAKQVNQAVWVCLLGATGVSIIAVALYVFLGESVSEGRLVSDASGLYSGPNFFSMTLILLLPYALFFFFLHRKVVVRVLCAGIIVIFSVANMMTESRSGLLGETLVVLLVFWKLRDWGVSLFKTLGIACLAAVLCLPLAPKGLWERFSTLFMNYDINKLDPLSKEHSAIGSTEQREELVVRALIITWENPIVGIGMNNFPSKSHERFNSGAEDWLGCHDTFLQISSELGIPGLIIYLLLLYTTWKTISLTRRRLKGKESEQPDSQQLRLLTDATMVSFCGYVLFSSVAHLGYQPYYFVVAGFAQSLSFISIRRAEAAAAKVLPATAAAA